MDRPASTLGRDAGILPPQRSESWIVIGTVIRAEYMSLGDNGFIGMCGRATHRGDGFASRFYRPLAPTLRT
jgi:hypothetical protein